MTSECVRTDKRELHFQQSSVPKITRIRKSTSEIFTWVMLLDPVNAVLVNLFGFLGQDHVLQVCSVEAHGEPKNIVDGKCEAVGCLNS